jgi:hypothetical protein
MRTCGKVGGKTSKVDVCLVASCRWCSSSESRPVGWPISNDGCCWGVGSGIRSFRSQLLLVISDGGGVGCAGRSAGLYSGLYEGVGSRSGGTRSGLGFQAS